MFSRIIFYELRHYGDLHITRNFVRYVIDNIKAENYTYVLTSDKKVFSDFPELSFEIYNEEVHPFKAYSEWKIQDNNLYINTSCGAGEMAFFNGTTVQTAQAIFKNYLNTLCEHQLPDDIIPFIPTIDFNYFKISPVDTFMESHKDKKKILIVNGITQSGQVPNFDVFPIIQILAQRHPDYMFFISNMPKNVQEPNVFYCKDIIGIDENDIVETSYFSRFCDVIVGRSSGVYTLSIERNNVINKTKKFICFCYTERDKDLGMCSIFPDLKDNFIWSNDFDYFNMLSLIEKHI